MDNEIVKEVLSVLNIEYESLKYFNDGTSSKVMLLNNKYLIKENNISTLKAEEEFYKYNNLEMFQKLIYVDKDYRFIVYSFIEGEVMYDVEDSFDLIENIKRIVSSYALYDKEGYGYLDELVSSWRSFLESEIYYSSENIKEYIKDMSFVNKCVDVLDAYTFEKKVLHGDFGTHNFIKENGKFKGVIDPMGVIGDPLYDFLFAIVSNVDVLTKVNIDELDVIANEEKNKVMAMLGVTLFSRISRCLKYHKEDIDIYMSIWNKLTQFDLNY